MTEKMFDCGDRIMTSTSVICMFFRHLDNTENQEESAND